ncbi:MAG: CDP-alcohol phosphatidyltransferase family protein [Candidatus Omnitrophota bacterium]
MINIANKISLFRILTIPFFVGLILYYSPERDFLRFIALGVFLLAVLSDAIDGYIARTKKQITKAGAILDPLADKLLLICAFIFLYFQGDFIGGIKIPLYVVVAVISRDVIILLGSLVIYMVRQDLEIKPSLLGKWTTTFQMLVIISILLQNKFTYIIYNIAFIMTIISGISYIRRGFKILYDTDIKNYNRNSR